MLGRFKWNPLNGLVQIQHGWRNWIEIENYCIESSMTGNKSGEEFHVYFCSTEITKKVVRQKLICYYLRIFFLFLFFKVMSSVISFFACATVGILSTAINILLHLLDFHFGCLDCLCETEENPYDPWLDANGFPFLSLSILFHEIYKIND
jgi:hypothetical protein